MGLYTLSRPSSREIPALMFRCNLVTSELFDSVLCSMQVVSILLDCMQGENSHIAQRNHTNRLPTAQTNAGCDTSI